MDNSGLVEKDAEYGEELDDLYVMFIYIWTML